VALLASTATIDVWRPAPGDRLLRWGVIGFFFVLYLFNCGSFGLWDPWETHYGEVARNMLESYDWINPWWGYRTKIGTEAVAGNWFYSKPIWIFWSELVFLKLIGLSDWAFRIPVALVGASAVGSLYMAVERIIDRRHACFVAVVTGLSPFIYMVSRQAQTDMPFVGMMTIALSFLAIAWFARRQELTDGQFLRRSLLFFGFAALNLVPQWSIVATDLADPNAGSHLKGAMRIGAYIQYNGIYHVLIYGLVAGVSLGTVAWPIFKRRGAWDDTFKDRTLRTMAMLCFYMLAAQATYAKGLLGFMLPGAVLFVWFLVSGHWRLLGRVELLRGIPLFLATGLPWYVAMFCRHGRAYYNRFFIHDHFNRVGSGVHQIDHGTFEHFIKWLGFGLFPWTGFVPMAIVAFAAGKLRGGSRVDTFKVFVLCWFSFAFMLFTLSSTKFHHYILPAVPALTMMVAFYLANLRNMRAERLRLHALLAVGLFAAVVVDLLHDPQHLRNLFTYKYDRPLPANLPTDWDATLDWRSDTHPIMPWSATYFAKHVGVIVANLLDTAVLRYATFIKIVAGLGGVSLLVMTSKRLRRVGMVGIALTAVLLAGWSLNYYMPTLTPHWSQRYLFEAYYDDCTRHPNSQPIEEAYTPLVSTMGLPGIAEFFDSQPKRVCEEDIISWLITWRGETFYSNNEIRPINKEAKQFEPYLRDFNKGRAFYVLMERGRTSGFASKLRRASRRLRDSGTSGWTDINDWKVDLVHNGSAYFVVGKCVPVRDRPQLKPSTARNTRDPDPIAIQPAVATPGMRPAQLARPSAAR